jgi:HD superfamily phosphohydrolase
MYSKLLGCNIHKSIRVSGLALKIIDTPEFQRMKEIKQLGLCHHVYSAAVHTRFEHSLGVYHLAGKMINKMQQEYPDREYDIIELGPDKKKLTPLIAECIKIAALCHDIGHGPFSHIFDDILLRDSDHCNKHHETRSCLIIQMLCERELKKELDQNHISFIKSIIDPKDNHFGALYQIVSNHLNGIDVDKFDYLARDSINLGLESQFNTNRLIDEFIIDYNGNIAYPKHCSIDIYQLFHSRYMMHKKVYSHKTVKLIELMLADIFLKVDKIFNISASIDNMETFCKLTDNTIYYYIQSVINPPLFIHNNLDYQQKKAVIDANELYQNIKIRNLYKQIFEISDEDNGQELVNCFLDHLLISYPTLDKEDFVIMRTRIGFVSGNKSDPFESVYFYENKENNVSFTIKKNYISGLMNNKIQEIRWHFICKNKEIYPLVTLEFENYMKKSSL